jgi:flagellar biosynthetic protein FliQ
MQDLDVVLVLHGAMLATFKLCFPMLMAPLLAGLVMALLQAVTQISDSALAFFPKLIATGLAGWLAGPFLANTLLDYSRSMFDQMIAIGGR